jgi:hypothetical protein
MASTINGTSTGNGGLISTGDDSGILNIQTNETTAISIDASQNITTANKFAKASMPTGSVLQVVSNTNTGSASTTSGTFVTTSQSISITPTSSSSKVLVIFTCSVSTLAANTGITFSIYRNSTSLHENGAYTATVGGNLSTGNCASYLDSPATTSATTYEIFFKETALAGTVTIQNRTLTAMEISA